MGDFSEKVALVTGAASGIRRANAVMVAREGARVVVSDVNEPGGQDFIQSMASIWRGNQVI
jgi:3(or 17)beta-hydroxysteroid dehydrogenase